MVEITVKGMNGTLEQIKLINAFKINSINKSFVIGYKGEEAGNNLGKIYVSEIVETGNNDYSLIGMSDDNVWKNNVVPAMKEIIDKTGNGVESIDLTGKTLSGDINSVKMAALAKPQIEELSKNYTPVKQPMNEAPINNPVQPGVSEMPQPSINNINNGIEPQPMNTVQQPNQIAGDFNPAEQYKVPDTPSVSTPTNPSPVQTKTFGNANFVARPEEENNSFNPSLTNDIPSFSNNTESFNTPSVEPNNDFTSKTTFNNLEKANELANDLNVATSNLNVAPEEKNNEVEQKESVVDPFTENVSELSTVDDTSKEEPSAQTVKTLDEVGDNTEENINDGGENLEIEEVAIKTPENMNENNTTNKETKEEKQEVDNVVKEEKVEPANDFKVEMKENNEEETKQDTLENLNNNDEINEELSTETDMDYKGFKKAQGNITTFVDGTMNLLNQRTKELHLTKRELEDFKEKCYSLEKTNADLNESNDLLVRETNLRENRIRTYERRIEELESEIKKLNSKIEDINRLNEVNEGEKQERDTRITSLEKQVDEKNDIIADLTGENKTLKEERDEALEKAEEYEQRMQIAEDQVEKLAAEVGGTAPDKEDVVEEKTATDIIEPKLETTIIENEIPEPKIEIVPSAGTVEPTEEKVNEETKVEEVRPIIEVVPTEAKTVKTPDITIASTEEQAPVESEMPEEKVIESNPEAKKTPAAFKVEDKVEKTENKQQAIVSGLNGVNLNDLVGLAGGITQSPDQTDGSGGFTRSRAA